MKHLTSIVATNHEGVIGVENTLPWRVKSDLAFFKEKTSGNAIIMGRNTFDSLGKRPLPKRYNIVVTHSLNLLAPSDNLIAAHSIAEAIYLADKWNSKKEAFVIGGASMYEQFSDFVDRYYITLVDKTVPEGDTFFQQEVFGNQGDWAVEQIGSGHANSEGDEADFAIFELNSERLSEVTTLRSQAVDGFKAKVPAKRRNTRQSASAGYGSIRDLLAHA